MGFPPTINNLVLLIHYDRQGDLNFNMMCESDFIFAFVINFNSIDYGTVNDNYYLFDYTNDFNTKVIINKLESDSIHKININNISNINYSDYINNSVAVIRRT